MPTSPLACLVHRLSRTALLRDTGDLSDGQLLDRFLTARDEAAFEALVRRHGPMVLGVCRRMLRHWQDAEDSFQATFLVLVRKGTSIVPREAVGNWLYGVAYRTALEARAMAARRRTREVPLTELPERAGPKAADWDDLRPILDEELARLSDKYRTVLVLCDLEGRTRREVARQFDLPEGTVSGRLTTARRMLAQRLARRGVTRAGVSLAAVLSENAASAGVPAAVLSSTVKTAAAVAAGGTVVSARVATLTEGVLRTMLLNKLKTATAVLLLAGVLGAGVGAGILNWITRAAEAGQPTKGEVKEPAFARRPAREPSPEVEKWQERAILREFKAFFTGLTFSPDGKTLAAADSEKTVRLWDVATLELRTTLKTAHRGFLSIAFSPDGKTIASTGADGVAKLWDVATGKERSAWTVVKKEKVELKAPYSTGFKQLAFSTDGKSLAVACDNLVKTFEIATGKEQATFEGHSDEIRTLVYALGGKVLVTGSRDRAVKVWDVATAKVRATLTDQGPGDGHVALSPGGKTLAISNVEKWPPTATLWDVETGKEKVAWKELEGRWFAFSPDGKTLAAVMSSADPISHVKLWDVATSKELATFKKDGADHSLYRGPPTFSPDGKVLVVFGAERPNADADFTYVLYVWELRK